MVPSGPNGSEKSIGSWWEPHETPQNFKTETDSSRKNLEESQ